MENINTITGFFASIWNMFNVNHPVLGIPFSVIYLGTFAIAFSIVILKPLLGIGSGVVGDLSRSTRNRIRSKRLNNRKEE